MVLTFLFTFCKSYLMFYTIQICEPGVQLFLPPYIPLLHLSTSRYNGIIIHFIVISLTLWYVNISWHNKYRRRQKIKWHSINIYFKIIIEIVLLYSSKDGCSIDLFLNSSSSVSWMCETHDGGTCLLGFILQHWHLDLLRS